MRERSGGPPYRRRCAIVKPSASGTRYERGQVSGRFLRGSGFDPRPLVACIHGGGCNSRYFQLAGASFAEAAVAQGFNLLLIDRPGHAGNDPFPSGRPIRDSIEAIRRLIDEVRGREALDHVGLGLVGHSIGGAVALMLSSGARGWPVAALAVSGIGDWPFPQMLEARFSSGEAKAQPPAELTEALFHTGGHPLDYKAVASLRSAAEPWLTAEVEEIVHRWPAEWPAVAAGVEAPVHLRLARHERVWQSGEDVTARMAARLAGSRAVDAAVMEGGGHLYEVSRRGPDLIRLQLNFLRAAL